MKKIVAYLCIIVLLLPATLVLPISAERVIDETIDSQSCDWPMYQHDLANTGYSPSKIPNELQPIWCKKIGDEALFYFNPPVVTDGKVFTISNQGVVYALDENNGSLIWKQRLLFRALYECASGCAPAVANGKVFVTCSTFFNLYGKIYALDADMGDIIWEHEILGGTSFSSPIATDGKVFVAAHLGVMGVIPKGMLYVFDENDGHLIWCRFLLGYPESTPAVVDDKVFIVTTPAPSFTLFFIGGGGQNYPFRQTSWVYSFNVDDGRMIWATPILGKAKSSPVIANG
jgi:outer membrane protein assembly factor BamB